MGRGLDHAGEVARISAVSRAVTSPRLQGEVGICALGRMPGEGLGFGLAGAPMHDGKEAPHPGSLPACGAKVSKVGPFDTLLRRDDSGAAISQDDARAAVPVIR